MFPHIPGLGLPADIQRMIMPQQSQRKVQNGLRKGMPEASSGAPIDGSDIAQALKDKKIGMILIGDDKDPE